jgi:hypothetical protein
LDGVAASSVTADRRGIFKIKDGIDHAVGFSAIRWRNALGDAWRDRSTRKACGLSVLILVNQNFGNFCELLTLK